MLFVGALSFVEGGVKEWELETVGAPSVNRRREREVILANGGKARRSPRSPPPLGCEERAVAEPNFWRVLYREDAASWSPGPLCVRESARAGRVALRSFGNEE